MAIDPDLIGEGPHVMAAKAGKEGPEEKLYTLEEAKKELAKKHCEVVGHDYHVVDNRPLKYPAGKPVFIRCTNCTETWSVKQN